MNDFDNQLAVCTCGKVALSAHGRPIVSAACPCISCQEAGRQFRRMFPNGALLDAEGGTAVVLFRKDRVGCLRGKEQLEDHRLQPTSQTRRVVAACCGTPMFLDFERGFWLSVYRPRFGDRAPPVTMKANSARFILTLLVSWVGMGFRSPKVNWGSGQASH